MAGWEAHERFSKGPSAAGYPDNPSEAWDLWTMEFKTDPIPKEIANRQMEAYCRADVELEARMRQRLMRGPLQVAFDDLHYAVEVFLYEFGRAYLPWLVKRKPTLKETMTDVPKWMSDIPQSKWGTPDRYRK